MMLQTIINCTHNISVILNSQTNPTSSLEWFIDCINFLIHYLCICFRIGEILIVSVEIINFRDPEVPELNIKRKKSIQFVCEKLRRVTWKPIRLRGPAMMDSRSYGKLSVKHNIDPRPLRVQPPAERQLSGFPRLLSRSLYVYVYVPAAACPGVYSRHRVVWVLPPTLVASVVAVR